jgi:hypothetical protein
MSVTIIEPLDQLVSKFLAIINMNLAYVNIA